MTIVVLGAGVLGLYTTFELIQRGIDPNTITIVAEYSPGDNAGTYTSPTAAAYFTAAIPELLLGYSKSAYTRLDYVKQQLGDHCGLAKLPIVQYYAFTYEPEYLASLQYIDDFKVLGDEGKDYRFEYTSWAFNPSKFIRKLFDYAVDKGVKFVNQKVSDILDIEADVVFNCTGNGAKTLKGAEDKDCFAVKGQSVMVSAPQLDQCITYTDRDEFTYVIKRPDSENAEVCLGGVNSVSIDTTIVAEHTREILEKTTKLCPQLLNGKPIESLKILRVVAGLRPSRKGGPRIEKEIVGHKVVIHNYGAGAAGFIIGLGMANKAVNSM